MAATLPMTVQAMTFPPIPITIHCEVLGFCGSCSYLGEVDHVKGADTDTRDTGNYTMSQHDEHGKEIGKTCSGSGQHPYLVSAVWPDSAIAKALP